MCDASVYGIQNNKHWMNNKNCFQEEKSNKYTMNMNEAPRVVVFFLENCDKISSHQNNKQILKQKEIIGTVSNTQYQLWFSLCSLFSIVIYFIDWILDVICCFFCCIISYKVNKFLVWYLQIIFCFFFLFLLQI